VLSCWQRLYRNVPFATTSKTTKNNADDDEENDDNRWYEYRHCNFGYSICDFTSHQRSYDREVVKLSQAKTAFPWNGLESETVCVLSISWLHNIQQEALLSLRNKASALHFFVAKLLSIKLCHPKPTSDDRADLLRTQQITFSYANTCAIAAHGLPRDPTAVWRLLFWELLRICHLHSFLRNCFGKPRKEVLEIQAQKQNVTWNSYSRSQVLGSLKPTGAAYRCVIMLVSSVKFQKKNNGNAAKLPLSATPLSFDAPIPGNSANIRIDLCRWQYRSIFIQIFVVGSEKRTHVCFVQ